MVKTSEKVAAAKRKKKAESKAIENSIKKTSKTKISKDVEDKLAKAFNKEELSEMKKKELQLILNEIESRKKNYSICLTKLDKIPQQAKLLEDMANRNLSEKKLRYFLYY
jgi:hypothetical protein